MRERISKDFSGVHDREALLAFQAAADYYFACSDDSSEEDYDLARKFSMIGLSGQGEDAANDAADPSMNSPVELPASSATTVTPTNDAQN